MALDDHNRDGGFQPTGVPWPLTVPKVSDPVMNPLSAPQPANSPSHQQPPRPDVSHQQSPVARHQIPDPLTFWG
jgi:hypothetical protein